MSFCKMCGISLAESAPTAASAIADSGVSGGSAGSTKAICAACGKGTPTGFAFCQHCGQRFAPVSGAVSSSGVTASPPSNVSAVPSALRSADPSASARINAPASPPGLSPASPGVVAAVNPTPPAGIPRSVARVTNNGMQRPEAAFAATVCPTPDGLPIAEAARPSQSAAAASAAVVRAPVYGLLITLNRDGSDGPSVEVSSENFDIGRSEGGLTFQDDSYLAPRHLRLTVREGRVLLRSLDTVNGVFIKVRESVELSSGDAFLVGKELLRFEALAPEERDPPSLIENGVRIFGSAPRAAWGRLRQLTLAGTTRDAWHLTRPELVLGREAGDVTFPDDEFMSRRHAAVKQAGAKVELADLHSSNGTFVRLRGERELMAGDIVRAGDQLLRFEC
jgi:pSer/pThr/pTyr-binding forkhead associated (FHA) protein